MRSWYKIAALAKDSAEMFIYDAVGRFFGPDENAVTALAFVDDLRGLPAAVKTLKIRVNSPGGDVFDALTIVNALRDWRDRPGHRVEVHIDGLAASAASLVPMAASEVFMAGNALAMLHEPHSLAVGFARDMRKVAEELERVQDVMIATYRWRMKPSDEEIRALLTATTWFDAAGAVEVGLADQIVEPLAAAACADTGWCAAAVARLGDVPEELASRFAALKPRASVPPPKLPPYPLPQADARAVVQACAAAGLPELSEQLLGLPMAQVTARLEQEKAARAAAQARAREITAACALAKQPDFSDFLIESGATPAQVRNFLVRLTAKLDRVEIDSHVAPDDSRRGPARSGLSPREISAALNPAAIYAERNRGGRA